MAGNLIELDDDRWTSLTTVGFIVVQNIQRQAWPIIGCPTNVTCSIWHATAGFENSYTGKAATSAASDAYHIYPGAEVTSVQAAGTVSNTLTLAPNNVAWANSDAIEVPDYPGVKVGFLNTQINNFWASPQNSSMGAGITWNGIVSGNDKGWVMNNNTTASLYSGLGGNLQAPFAAFESVGIWRNGIVFLTAPTTQAILVQCPAAGCLNGTFTPVLATSAVSFGGDYLKYENFNKWYRITSNNQAHNFDFGPAGAFITESVLASGIVDGTAPVTATTGTTATLGAGTYKSGYTFNQESTAATAVTYTLPATAVGLQYCVKNSIVSGTGAANTGVITVYPPASSFVILNGTRNTVGGGGTHGIASAGAAGDAACFVAVDATDWEIYVQKGTWTLN